MKRILIGAIVGAALTAGVSVAAKLEGPEIRGESGTLTGYAVVVDGERVCSDPWVSIGDQVIECDRVK